MPDDRRYQDEEVRRIFEAAAEADSSGRTPSSGEGMSLAELQEIGREVGLSPERIAQAASALDASRGVTAPRRLVGMPLSVGRTVDLPRAPTDIEWEMLVSELRETFRARGHVSGHGGLREWTNGNLHAFIEPTGSGYRLRLGTLKGTAVPAVTGGVIAAVFAVVMAVMLMLRGESADALTVLFVVGGAGAAATATSLLRLPSWARRREEQMAYIASRAQELLAPGE